MADSNPAEDTPIVDENAADVLEEMEGDSHPDDASGMVVLEEAVVDDDDERQDNGDDEGSFHGDVDQDEEKRDYMSDEETPAPGMGSADVERLVSHAIESKLSGMQMQMQAMVQALAVMQGAAQATTKEVVEPKAGSSKVDEVKVEKKVEKKREEKKPVRETVEYWEKLINEVKSILEIKTEEDVKEDMEMKDAEAGDGEKEGEKKEGEKKEGEKKEGEKKEGEKEEGEKEEGEKKEGEKKDGEKKSKSNVPILPPHQKLVDIWKSFEKDFNSDRKPRIKPHVHHDYRWTEEMFLKYGRAPAIDDEFFDLNEHKGQNRSRSVLGQPAFKTEMLVYDLDRHTRCQGKLSSHGLMFLDALSKGLKNEKDVSDETIDMLLMGLKRCLVDIIDSTVRCSIENAIERRRIWVERMGTSDTVAKKKLMDLPIEGSKLFSGQSAGILKNPKSMFPPARRFQNVQRKRGERTSNAPNDAKRRRSDGGRNSRAPDNVGNNRSGQRGGNDSRRGSSGGQGGTGQGNRGRNRRRGQSGGGGGGGGWGGNRDRRNSGSGNFRRSDQRSGGSRSQMFGNSNPLGSFDNFMASPSYSSPMDSLMQSRSSLTQPGSLLSSMSTPYSGLAAGGGGGSELSREMDMNSRNQYLEMLRAKTFSGLSQGSYDLGGAYDRAGSSNTNKGQDKDDYGSSNRGYTSPKYGYNDY